MGATATVGVQYYVTNGNILISVLYNGYSQTDPNLPVVKNTLAGATVGSPSVPNTTAVVDVTTNSFVMEYNYLATAAGTDVISLVQGGTVFDTVAIVVSSPSLSATGLSPNTSLPASTVNTTGATLNPPATATGGVPPYTYTLTTDAGHTTPNTFTITNNGTANAALKVQNPAVGPGTTLSWSGSIQVTDSAAATQFVTGTYTVSLTTTSTPLVAVGRNDVFTYHVPAGGSILANAPVPVSISGGTPPYSISMTLSNTQSFQVFNNNSSNAYLRLIGSNFGTFSTSVSMMVSDKAGNTATATGSVTMTIT
jgi:hypothetical protein